MGFQNVSVTSVSMCVLWSLGRGRCAETVMLSSRVFLSDCTKRCSCPTSDYRSDIDKQAQFSCWQIVISTYPG